MRYIGLFFACLVLAALLVVPAVAQDGGEVGCDMDVLAEEFETLSTLLPTLDTSTAMILLDSVSARIAAVQAACAEGGDTSDEIPQSRAEDGAFVLGDPDAPITVIEFADFLCPHCQNYEPVIQQVIETYVVTGMAQFEYRFFPAVDPTYSFAAARAAECVEILSPGSFWLGHDTLFEIASSERFGDSSITRFADEMDISDSALRECIETAEQVDTDTSLGLSLGVQGTPAIMVRYADGVERWIELDGVTYNRGTVPFEVIATVIEAAQ